MFLSRAESYWLLNYLYYNNLNVKWQFLFYVRLGAGEVGGRNFNFLTLLMRKKGFFGLVAKKKKKSDLPFLSSASCNEKQRCALSEREKFFLVCAACAFDR